MNFRHVTIILPANTYNLLNLELEQEKKWVQLNFPVEHFTILAEFGTIAFIKSKES